MIFTVIFRNYSDMINKYHRLESKEKIKVNFLFSGWYLFCAVMAFVFIHDFVDGTKYFKNLGIFSYREPLIINGKIPPFAELGTLSHIQPLTYFIVFLKFFVSHKISMWITAFIAKESINEKYNEIIESENEARARHNQYLTTQRENAEREQYRKQMQEIEDREYAKTKGQSKAMLSLYEGQLKLLQDHKRRGMDIERESFELRKKLLELERQENSEMINDLLKTLDRIYYEFFRLTNTIRPAL